MALTLSKMTELSSEAPSFDLPIANPEVDGLGDGTRTLEQVARGKPLVVVFMCNHCPFVMHIEGALTRVAHTCMERGVQVVGISSNDARQYPEDSFVAMTVRARENGYPFPYLYDESQAIARAYGAECTPDIFLYDADLKLAYRGCFDETRPGQGEATGAALLQSMDEMLSFGVVTMPQRPSMGCNIKWK